MAMALVVAMAATAALCITIGSPRSLELLCVIYGTVEYMGMCQNVQLCGISQQTEEKYTKPSQSLHER